MVLIAEDDSVTLPAEPVPGAPEGETVAPPVALAPPAAPAPETPVMVMDALVVPAAVTAPALPAPDTPVMVTFAVPV
jgi:hypothetical protein